MVWLGCGNEGVPKGVKGGGKNTYKGENLGCYDSENGDGDSDDGGGGGGSGVSNASGGADARRQPPSPLLNTFYS